MSVDGSKLPDDTIMGEGGVCRRRPEGSSALSLLKKINLARLGPLEGSAAGIRGELTFDITLDNVRMLRS
jgi:hypothetical protein